MRSHLFNSTQEERARYAKDMRSPDKIHILSEDRSSMKLPNGDRAEIPMQKLLGYCLNPEHPSGKHKARVFASVLGIIPDNADTLRELIQTAAVEGEVVQQDTTAFGQLFKVDWTVLGTQDVQLRTIWEITSTNLNPRLVSAFIK